MQIAGGKIKENRKTKKGEREKNRYQMKTKERKKQDFFFFISINFRTKSNSDLGSCDKKSSFVSA